MSRVPEQDPGRPLVTRRFFGWTGREIGVALWSSFLAASLATVLFFATFDPASLYDDAEILREAFASRLTGYTLGFFFFWSLTLLASGIAVYLMRGDGRHEPPPGPAP